MSAAIYDVLVKINANLGRIAEAVQTLAEIRAQEKRRADLAEELRQRVTEMAFESERKWRKEARERGIKVE